MEFNILSFWEPASHHQLNFQINPTQQPHHFSIPQNFYYLYEGCNPASTEAKTPADFIRAHIFLNYIIVGSKSSYVSHIRGEEQKAEIRQKLKKEQLINTLQ